MFFTAWRTSFQKDHAVRQVTWVAGPETVFVEDVVETIKSELKPEPHNVFPLVAGDDSERLIWAEIEQEPADGQRRLVIIRNADRLKNLDRLIPFIQHRATNPNTYLVFVSRANELPRLPPPKEDRYAKGELVPYLAALTGKGHIIECKPVTQSTADKAVLWVMEKAKINRKLAEYLLERCNGNLRLARDLSAKLRVFGGEVTVAVINLLLAEQPRDDFADALLGLDRKTALLALKKLTPSEYSQALGMLDARLEFAGMLHDLQVEGASPAEIGRAAGNKRFLLDSILPIAKHYNAKRRLQIRNMIALADEALRSGVTEGPMEAIVAFW